MYWTTIELDKIKVFRCIINAVDRCSLTTDICDEKRRLSFFKSCNESAFESTRFLERKLQDNNHRGRHAETKPGTMAKLMTGNWPFGLPRAFSRAVISKGIYSIRPNDKSLFVLAAFYWKNFEEITLTEIAKRLKEYGYNTSAYGVANMLRNPVYAGVLSHQGLEYRANFKAIVSKEIFDQVQNKIPKRVFNYKESKENKFPLNGMLRIMGHEMDCLIGYIRPKGTRTYHYYKNTPKKSGGHGVNLRVKELHSMFGKFYKDQMSINIVDLNLSLRKIHKQNLVPICNEMMSHMEQEIILSDSLNKQWLGSDMLTPKVLTELETRRIAARAQASAWKEFADEESFVNFGIRIIKHIEWAKLDYEFQKEVPKIWFPTGVIYDPLTKTISPKYISSVFRT